MNTTIHNSSSRPVVQFLESPGGHAGTESNVRRLGLAFEPRCIVLAGTDFVVVKLQILNMISDHQRLENLNDFVVINLHILMNRNFTIVIISVA